MDKKNSPKYQAPKVAVVKVASEKGFASSWTNSSSKAPRRNAQRGWDNE